MNTYCNIFFSIDTPQTPPANTISLIQTAPNTNLNTLASVHISFNNLQDAMFLRLDELIETSKNAQINIELKNLSSNRIVSHNYKHYNPWKNSFKRNLPMITVPINAGSETNAFLSNLGSTSSLGIVNSDGGILHPVKMIMRPSKEVNFYIYFFSLYNTPIKFQYPSYLYFHFEIESLHES